MARPIILGVVGDSATGKTTISRGLVHAVGGENVTHVCTDDYHRYDRQQRAELDITPLNPDCNYLDIIAQDLGHLRGGEPFLKPVYRHSDGTHGPPVYVKPTSFAVVEGLLGYHTDEMRRGYDVRVYLDPPEALRREWKVQRDTSRRGYTPEQVLAELDRREPESEKYIRPQQRHADIVVSFLPRQDGDQAHLDAVLILRPTLPHPDLSAFLADDRSRGLTLAGQGLESKVLIPGDIDPDRASELEEALWRRMFFASHLRPERLGEFTIGTDVHRSDSLALVQLLILFHVFTAKASVALGGEGTRSATQAAEA
ncbi:MAG: phosphoribulokinase [Gaiellaceae bacterium]